MLRSSFGVLCLYLALGKISGQTGPLEDDDANFAIRMRIRNGGKVRKGGTCKLRERDLILQAVRETVGAYHDDSSPETDVDPWWCTNLCLHYEQEYCTIFHPACPHPNDQHTAIESQERRTLANNRLVEIYDVDRHAHPSSPEKRRRAQKQSIKTKCHAAKVSVLTRIRDELGQGISKSCISFLRFRMDLSCFLVNEPNEDRVLTKGTFEDEDKP